MVLTPALPGAPSRPTPTSDRSPGISLFEDEERAGLALMRSLVAAQQRRAIVAHSMVGGDLPPGRRHFADNLHLGGAHQDNRIVPYEGLQGHAALGDAAAPPASIWSPPTWRRCRPVRTRRGSPRSSGISTRRISAGSAASPRRAPFYYRIQSPVIFIEFDHHAGVFLTNAEPAKFHVHTIVRTPNGNDYGIDLLRLHYAHAHR